MNPVLKTEEKIKLFAKLIKTSNNLDQEFKRIEDLPFKKF